MSAIPENLWTSDGQFSKPSHAEAVLEWRRIEYGMLWTWLVHDSCTTEAAWYFRIEPRILTLYVAFALLACVGSSRLLTRYGRLRRRT